MRFIQHQETLLYIGNFTTLFLLPRHQCDRLRTNIIIRIEFPIDAIWALDMTNILIDIQV